MVMHILDLPCTAQCIFRTLHVTFNSQGQGLFQNITEFLYCKTDIIGFGAH